MRTTFLAAISITLTICGTSSIAARVDLNESNISVSVGSSTGAGTSNSTFFNGQTIDKVIDAASAGAIDDDNQTTHIWYTFDNPDDGLELIFNFGVSYDITTLHFSKFSRRTI